MNTPAEPLFVSNPTGQTVLSGQAREAIPATIRAVAPGPGDGNLRAAPLKSWRSPVLMSADQACTAYQPAIALDACANAYAVWLLFDGTRERLWARRYRADAGWGVAALVQTEDCGSAMAPSVATQASGHAVAVWEQLDAGRHGIWASRCSPGEGWQAPVPIDTGFAAQAHGPRVVMDLHHNAMAVWRQSDAAHSSIWCSRLEASGAGWSAPRLVELAGDTFAMGPRIAMNVRGQAMAVWYQLDGPASRVWAKRFTPQEGWAEATQIGLSHPHNGFEPHTALNAQGDAMAVWSEFDGVRNTVWARPYAADGGWGLAQALTPMEYDAFEPQVAMDAGGRAIAVWTQVGLTQARVWARRYTQQRGWGAATPLTARPQAQVDAHGPQVTMTASGSAFALWRQFDGAQHSVWINAYR